MRIQTCETLATPDVETVLRVLEWSLRDISIEVERDGRRITVRGLGPSQRTMNRNDIAVVEVSSENDHTVIRADITYLSSALLGGVPQDDLVRSKLDRVLDRVEAELGTKRIRGEAVTEFADPVREPETVLEVEHVLVPEPFFQAGYTSEPQQALEREYAIEREHGIEQKQAIEQEQAIEAEHNFEPVDGGRLEHFVALELVQPVPRREPVVEAEVSRSAETVVAFEPEAEVAAESAASVAMPVATETVPAVAAAVEKPTAGSSSRVGIPVFQTLQPENAPPKRWGLLATVVCMLAAVALFLAWPYLVGLVHERLSPSTDVTDGSTVGETKVVADKEPIPAPDANATAAARNAAIHNESDPRVWLESWADAMRGQDASAQASFYADPVDHYALKSNVSNADVWLDKKNAIQSRPTSWTFRLEDVVVEPRPDESMRVRLTKHYTFQADGGKVSDQLIHSQLKLRKIDGQWKIVSEQNLATGV